MRRASIVAVTLLVTMCPASSLFMTYSQWEQEPPDRRSAYIAGLFDSLVGFGSSEQDKTIGLHYFQCVQRSGMHSAQLAENVRRYASARPEHHGGAVIGPFIKYLIELCGRPPV